MNTRFATRENESASHGQFHMGLPTLIVGYECTKRTVRTDGPHQIAHHNITCLSVDPETVE
jgi:hypothetical protein